MLHRQHRGRKFEVLVPEGMILRTVSAARYAKYTHKGPLEEFQNTLDYIWGSVLPKSRYKRLGKLDLEVYPEDFEPAKKQVVIDVLIPMEKIT